MGNRTFPAAAVRSIQVNGGGGNDTIRIDDTRLAFTTTRSTVIDGGGGNDTLRGGKGAETLRGSIGNDTITGLGGNDVVDLGAGTDTAVWNVGQGNDQVQGGTGADTQRAVGTAGADAFTLSTQTNRARIAAAGGSTRTLGVEKLTVVTLGGDDSAVLNEMSALGLTEVIVDLGPGDDPVTVNGTDGFDEIQVFDTAPGVRIVGGLTDFSANVTCSGASRWRSRPVPTTTRWSWFREGRRSRSTAATTAVPTNSPSSARAAPTAGRSSARAPAIQLTAELCATRHGDERRAGGAPCRTTAPTTSPSGASSGPASKRSWSTSAWPWAWGPTPAPTRSPPSGPAVATTLGPG